MKITPSTFHGFCPKGKQKANCGGFSFSIPANFVNGWSWGSALYRDYSALSKDKQASSGLCFDAEGTAYTLKFVNGLNREVFEHLVEDLSSYSWRRAGPTAATLMQFTLRCAHWATGQTTARLPRKPRCHSTIAQHATSTPSGQSAFCGWLWRSCWPTNPSALG